MFGGLAHPPATHDTGLRRPRLLKEQITRVVPLRYSRLLVLKLKR
jgi:hypothetical protein